MFSVAFIVHGQGNSKVASDLKNKQKNFSDLWEVIQKWFEMIGAMNSMKDHKYAVSYLDSNEKI